MSAQSDKEGSFRPFSELTIIPLSPFFVVLLVVSMVLFADVFWRSWVYSLVLIGLAVFSLGLVAGLAVAYHSTKWLTTLLKTTKSRYNLLYHIVFLLFPAVIIVVYFILSVINVLIVSMQSTVILVVFAVSGFSLGIAGTTISALLFTYLRVRRNEQDIVWVYHRGGSRFTGTVELSRISR